MITILAGFFCLRWTNLQGLIFFATDARILKGFFELFCFNFSDMHQEQKRHSKFFFSVICEIRGWFLVLLFYEI